MTLRVAEAATMDLNSSQESCNFRSNLPPISPVALLAICELLQPLVKKRMKEQIHSMYSST